MSAGTPLIEANGRSNPTPAPEEAPQETPRGPSLRRRIRLGLGLGLLSIAAWLGVSWLLSPALWNITSSQAVVNARIMTLHSPIEGTMAESPPPVGQAVTAGSPLLRVENPLADDSHLEELKTEAASLAQRVTALKKQHEELEALKVRLSGNVRKYQAAAERRLQSRLEEAKAVAEAADAFAQQRRYVREQAERVAQGNAVARQEVVTARLAEDAAWSKTAQAQTVVRHLSDELESLRQGSYRGLADGGNDVPYSQQRIHDLEIRQHDIIAKVEEFTARATEVRRQLKIETERLRRPKSGPLHEPLGSRVCPRPLPDSSPPTPPTPGPQLPDGSRLLRQPLAPAPLGRR